MWLLPLASASAGEKFQIPVAASARVLGYAPLWVADKKGFFGREGLRVEVTVTRGTTTTLRALVAERIHAALAGNDGVMSLVEKGIADLAIIAGGSKSTHMIIAKSNIKDFEDLRGATIGTSASMSGTAFLLRRVLKAKGDIPPAEPPPPLMSAPGVDDPVWQKIAEPLRRLVREGAYGSWFGRIGFHGIDEGVLTLSTLSQIAADRIKRDYVDAILHAAEVAEVYVDRVIITLRKDRR